MGFTDYEQFSRPGLQDGQFTVAATDSKTEREALYLTLFAGEVLRAMARKTQLSKIIMSKTIPHGKSAEFPAISRIGTAYHTPGDNIIDDGEVGALSHVKRPVHLDDKAIASTFIDSQEEDMTEYDIRAPYAEQLGEALAVLQDTNQYIMLGQAARTRLDALDAPGDADLDPDARLLTQLGALGEGGYVVLAATPTAAEMYAAIESAAAIMDAKDIPEEDRYVPLLPADYWYIMGARDYINRDYGGTAILERGTQTWLAGMRVIKTNNLPQTLISLAASTDSGNWGQNYVGDFGRTGSGATTAGYLTTCFHKAAIGSIYLRGIETETSYEADYQGDLLIAKMQMGTNVLRPECAVEINTDAVQPGVAEA